MVHNAHSIKHTSICNGLKNEKQKTTTNCFLLFIYFSRFCQQNNLSAKLFTRKEIFIYV